MKNEEADNEEEQTYWYVCEYCDEGYYSPYEHPDSRIMRFRPVCERCWKEAHE